MSRIALNHLALVWGGLLAVSLSSLLVTPSRAEEKIEVVTTLTVLSDLVQSVGGDSVHVVTLADPSQDPHFVQPRPTLMKRSREADLFVEVGLQLELWAQKVIDGAGNPGILLGQSGRVISSKGVPTVQKPEVLSRAAGDIHPYGNPHIWLDPVRVRKMAENIKDGLDRVNPKEVKRNEEKLNALLDKLDTALYGEKLIKALGSRKLNRLARQEKLFPYLERKELIQDLGGWLALFLPLRGKKIVTYHKTWDYLAARFGFEIALTLEEKPGIPPSARHRDRVIQTMKDSGIKTILMATYYDRKVADAVAREVGAEVITASLVPLEGQDYFMFLESILHLLKESVE